MSTGGVFTEPGTREEGYFCLVTDDHEGPGTVNKADRGVRSVEIDLSHVPAGEGIWKFGIFFCCEEGSI